MSQRQYQLVDCKNGVKNQAVAFDLKAVSCIDFRIGLGVAWNKILWGVDSGLPRGRVSSLKIALEAHHAYDSR
ncbi:hypothetical protein GCM10007919_22430 [Rhizobium indigoferae]|nr:hypothetical protein GCM10007919_22430 [Rhizobium indigoferae]